MNKCLMVYSRSENCVFPALRCGPAGQGFAPGNTMFYGLEHMRHRYHSYMFDGRFVSEDTPSGGHILDVFYTCSSVQTIMLCLPLL